MQKDVLGKDKHIIPKRDNSGWKKKRNMMWDEHMGNFSCTL